MIDSPATADTSTTPSPAPAPESAATPSSDLFSRGAPPPVNDRSRGHSPTLDAREQLAGQQGANKIKVLDAEHDEQHVADALARDAEAAIRRQSLPQSPSDYELKLPQSFRPPEGMSFELDPTSPLLQAARQKAHALGLDQNAFSELISLYAADRIGTEMQLHHARQAELQKLGAAGNQRVDQISTWLRSMAGEAAEPIVGQLKTYPHAQTIKMFEAVISKFSNQGGAQYDQRGRVQEESQGRIPGYENMDFKARRVAQMTQNPAAPRRGRE